MFHIKHITFPFTFQQKYVNLIKFVNCKILKLLNSAAMSTKRGKLWSDNAVYRVLTNDKRIIMSTE